MILDLTCFLLVASSLAPVCYAALRQHSLVITNGTSNPDGIPRPSWPVNGQTPGPHLVWDEGDNISVTVINNDFESITIHWHGHVFIFSKNTWFSGAEQESRIEQYRSPWSDGVPGLTQYPIQPGQNFVYNFTVYQAGHHCGSVGIIPIVNLNLKMVSKASPQPGQLDLRLTKLHIGTIYIRPKATKAKPFSQITNDTTVLAQLKRAELDPLPLHVYDYRHHTSEYLKSEWERTDIEQLCTDNILVDGKGPVRCPSMATYQSVANPLQLPVTNKGCMYPNSTLGYPYPDSKPELVNTAMWYQCSNTSTTYEVFTVKQSDGWVSFNLLNSGSVWDLRISIDQHKLYFYAADGGYVNIQTATSALIPIGERYQFFLKLDQPVSDYTIRVAAVVLPQIISGHAILSYTVNGATSVGAVKTSVLPTPKTPYIDYAGTIIKGGKDLITLALSPFPAMPPPQGNPSLTLNMNITRAVELGNKWSPPPSNAVPLLFQTGQIASLDKKVYFSYRNGSIVDLIFTVTAGNPALHPPHPIHKHGVKAWHLGSGIGEFPYPTVQAAVAARFTGINMKNPPLRDDFVTPVAITGKAWSVVRLLAGDPGPVVMHCHIEPHLDTGMAVEGVSDSRDTL
ncbi:unnamed protein product [Rhizoctonia solani]|uniref:Multicopper oxidase n=1 Tax=Rhizoctonia solani TaxID=456999 RepID=A0A8H2ZVZ3_9AGAM|nr:unnamed protein product [Rhizoctonia solani]